MAVLDVQGASAAPYGPPLLADIAFSLEPGEILSVIGPNGAGKSTLLHALAGGIATTEGDIRLGGRLLPQWPRLARARALAMLPQQSTLAFPFRVEEVILLGRSPHASGAAEDRAVLAEVMRATDTERLRHRLYTHLSGGERQRVQLARVLAQLWRAADSDTRVLLLDEPTTGLDLEHQDLVMASLRQLAATGCAVVMVAHDFNLAAAMAQRVLVLRNGQQVCQGTPAEVFTGRMFEEVFCVQVHIATHPLSGAPLVVHP